MILIVFGTRPEWIKIKPVIDKIQSVIPFRLLFSGQHLSLIDDSVMNYPVESLSIGSGENRLNTIVSSILSHNPTIFKDVTHVMVQGDTTSAFAVALSAFHHGIKIIHLEAGLRTFDKYNPYPEEFNRCAITAMSDVHLCPTETSKNNVLASNPKDINSIHIVGNTVLDNLLELKPVLEDFIFITMHRRENYATMDRWFYNINLLAINYPKFKFIFPMHPSPNVQMHKHILSHVSVTDPMSHEECVDHIRRCCLIISDSGGIQEEACFLQKKTIVCRQNTERVEGLNEFSFICKIPADLDQIFVHSMTNVGLVTKPCPYGDGHASERISHILRHL